MFQRSTPAVLLLTASVLAADDTPTRSAQPGPAFVRIKAHLDAVPAIDTHNHLWPSQRLRAGSDAMNLYRLLKNSYFSWYHPLPVQVAGGSFSEWWSQTKPVIADARATSFYRYLLPAFRDLYGLDFDRMTDEQARDPDRRILRNYADAKWIRHVVTERANTELVLIDPFWAPFAVPNEYPFVVSAVNVNTLFRGFHPSEYGNEAADNNPYAFAAQHGLRVDTVDEYLSLVEAIITGAKKRGAICLKQTLAYARTLQFDNTPAERARAAFGRPRSELSPDAIKAFEDFIMWRIVEMAARHDLPLQIHTGQVRIQGANPMLLVDLIEANRKTKFVLFHGGFPWVGETGFIAMRHASHVWIDSVWLPTLSYTMAKRAFHEWLEVMPSNRLLWGADGVHAEGIYGATVEMRRCVAEVLAEKVERGDLLEGDACRIGRQILRDNALSLYPSLRPRLWRHAATSAPAFRSQ